ncbi:hypothetical protein [Methanobacterium petrolearium]|uniref:hypothetical protein n=1 Tax=Methanobacterium petrolearium TaxID=710190 RepID=UPI001AE8CCBB|nr:hypothetical protein [Methanobacterium petrolearium]MBP1945085.1 hypothetical protein [Methanobacterium petrolearium]BDZ71005.1 hypothetical protein GCM10025861_15220 [Methanobacterium petrolearium]
MITKVKIETTNEKKINTNIPSRVGNDLKLCPGDSLEWDLQKKDGLWVAIIRKVE